jgi:hypothetical protein
VLLVERMRMPGSCRESRSDVAIIVGIKVCFLALIVVPALDVRFGWTPRLPLWSEVCGGILLLGGQVSDLYLPIAIAEIERRVEFPMSLY